METLDTLRGPTGTWRPIRVLLDWDGEHERVFDASTNGDRWNGWECPYFTREQADRVVAELPLQYRDDVAVFRAEYDAATDTYRFLSEDGGEWEVFGGVEIDGARYYPIGAYCWTWRAAAADRPAHPPVDPATGPCDGRDRTAHHSVSCDARARWRVRVARDGRQHYDLCDRHLGGATSRGAVIVELALLSDVAGGT